MQGKAPDPQNNEDLGLVFVRPLMWHLRARINLGTLGMSPPTDFSKKYHPTLPGNTPSSVAASITGPYVAPAAFRRRPVEKNSFFTL